MRKTILILPLSLLVLSAGFLPAASSSAEWSLTVTAESCPVFNSPNPDSPVILSLPKNSRLTSFHKIGDWYRVIVGPGEEGYLIIGYVRSGDLQVQVSEEPEVPELWKNKPHYYTEVGFTIRLFLGYNMISRGDVNAGAHGLLDTSNDKLTSWGLIPDNQFSNMKSIFEMGGDVLYNLTPRLAVGLGAGSLKGGEINIIRYSSQYKAQAGQTDTDLRFNAIPIRFIFKYTHPLSDLFNLTLTGLPILYLAKVNFALINPLWGAESIQIRTHSQSFGFSGIVGLELKLSPNAVFYMEGIGRYANLSGFKGEQKIYDEDFSEITNIKTEGTLYYVEGDRPGLVVSQAEPSGFNLVKRAVFNYSGFSLRAGIAVRF